MLAFYKKFSKTFIDLGLLGFTIFLFMSILTYSFKIAAPVFIALFIYIVVAPFLNFLRKKGLKLSLATPISIFLFLGIIVIAFFTIGSILTIQIQSLSVLVPKCIEFLKHFILDNAHFVKSKLDSVPPEVMLKIQEVGETVITKSSALASDAAKGLLAGITSTFSNAFNFIVGLILAYFLCSKIDDWKANLNNKTPKSIKNGIEFLKIHVFKGIGKYLKAQLKLIGCSFVIIFLGLLIAGVDNAFSIAVLAAILDILPLLGMPVIFVPWAIYSIVVGKLGFGIFLLCLLATSMIFRQIAEPKIAGDSLGVSAFTMLSVMIISLSVFGMAGIIASPLLIIMLKAVYEQWYLSKWIYMPEDEFDNEQ